MFSSAGIIANAGIIAAAVAALLHCFIFYLEAIAWESPRARSVFGMTSEQAQETTDLAYNQGFYNLFLALEVFVGIGFLLGGHHAIGMTLIVAGVVSMLAAATVLALKFPDKRSAAMKQGALPLLAVACLLLALFL
ncbi:MAG: DUF1304 domain-containing protein [Propionibacteriaceae bacterium]